MSIVPNNGNQNAFGAIPVYDVGFAGAGAGSTMLNITAATVLKASPGTMLMVSVVVAGSAPGGVHDCITTGAASSANQFFTIPNTVGSYAVNFPAKVGITITPGTGQTLSAYWI